MKYFVLILLILCCLKLNAQNYDLIVTSKGDSIACHIDSITEIDIHFEMKINNMWLHTYTPLSECAHYEYNTINELSVKFKPRTSYIEKIIPVKISTQNYDLVVTNKGDSIACHIDSITNSHVYFEIKFNDRWVKTNLEINNVKEYKFNAFENQIVIFKEGTSYIKEIKDATKYFDRSRYANRYLFGPSAFPMQKDLFSYSNITIGLHDMQYAFSDRFSLGFGTTMFFFPMYVMSVYSIPLKENSSFAIGDLLMFSPYADDISFFGNLLYGMYSKGDAENNYSIGLGVWTTTSTDVAGKTISPAINYSSVTKAEYNSYFITENYAFMYNINQSAGFHDDPDINFEEEFLQNKYIVGGISGFRVIGKKHPKHSWQFALAYIFIISEDVPDKYKQPGWDIHGEFDNIRFIAWPIISYTIKI